MLPEARPTQRGLDGFFLFLAPCLYALAAVLPLMMMMMVMMMMMKANLFFFFFFFLSFLHSLSLRTHFLFQSTDFQGEFIDFFVPPQITVISNLNQ